MLLAALGYVLIEWLRALGLQGTRLACAQIDTLRIKLQCLARASTPKRPATQAGEGVTTRPRPRLPHIERAMPCQSTLQAGTSAIEPQFGRIVLEA